jgi:pimeloyl-ACP methyl ester carboxylesterase
MDRLRESREGTGDQPSILNGEEKKEVHSLDGTALYVDYLGERDSTVFLAHGYTCDGTEFRYQKPYLADKYRVVSLDFRGHGRSEISNSGDYHFERLAEDLKAVVDAFEPERFVVAGHSMGGLAAFKFYELFAKEYEGRLKGLAIIHRKRKDYQNEVAILERFANQKHAPGVKPQKLLERLEKARTLLDEICQ